MAKSKKYINSLVRALEQSSLVAWAVSGSKDGQKITWANESCLNWLGCTIEQLAAEQLKYSAVATEAGFHHLALPPDWFANPEAARNFPIATPEGKSLLGTALPLDNGDKKSTTILVACWPGNAFDPANVDTKAALNQPELLHHALAVANPRKRFSLASLVGESSVARELLRKVTAASESQCDVLVAGPVGSGREHVARTIINVSSPNKVTDLVVVHGSIADPVSVQQSMKSLLQSPHSGKQSGALLLLDVDQLSPASLRELTGFLDLPKFDARVLATATQQPQAVDLAGLLRRLATIRIDLVAIADRKADIPLLAQSVLESINLSTSRQMSGFSRQAMESICECEWPKNFDQLAATIELAVESASGNIVQLSDFPDSFHHLIAAQRSVRKPKPDIPLDDYLLEIERRLVERALKLAKGNKTAAANTLGISRAKLLRRLEQFNLTQHDDPSADLLDPSVFLEEPDGEL